MKNIDFDEFQHMIDSAINASKSSISFQIYGYDNDWVVRMTDKLCEKYPFYRDYIEDVCGAEISFKE